MASSSSASPIANSTTSTEVQALLDTYARYGYFSQIRKLCSEALKRSPDPELRFFRAFALSEESSFSEALRELDIIQDSPEHSLATTALMIQIHKVAKLKDKQALDNLKEKLKNLSKTSDPATLTFAGRYFWLADKEKQARQCVEKVLASNKRHVQCLTLLAWLNLEPSIGATSSISSTSSSSSSSASFASADRKCLTLLETAIKLSDPNKREINALLGRSKYYERKKRYEKALEDLHLLIAQYPDFSPAYIEKAQILLLQNNWDEAAAIVQRQLKRDVTDLSCHRLLLLFVLTRESKLNVILQQLNSVVEALDRSEPSNARLLFELAKVTSRLSNRKKQVLQVCLTLLERAAKLQPESSSIKTEQGNVLLMLEEYQSALTCFQEAAKLDESNLAPLFGRIKCKLGMKDKEREAKQELEFLAELNTGSPSAEFKLLEGQVALQLSASSSDISKATQLLLSSAEAHLETINSNSSSSFSSLYIQADPDLIMQLVTLMMLYSNGSEPLAPGDPPSPSIKCCVLLLSTLTDLWPGNLEAWLLLAKCFYLSGDFDAAERSLGSALRLDPACARAHLQLAQIADRKEDYKQSSLSLEQARSFDFEIRNTPAYHLLKARLLQASGALDDACKTLQATIELPGVRRVNKTSPVPLQDRLAVFLELASVYTKSGLHLEASKMLNDARLEFTGADEQERINLAEADLALSRRDFDVALNLFRAIPRSSLYFTRAQVKMADIYLHSRKNKKLYVLCFRQLAEMDSSLHAQFLLADAYLNIQEPDQAISAYEDAMVRAQTDEEKQTLAIKIGRALVMTHDYERAVQYYTQAAASLSSASANANLSSSSPNFSLRLQLLHELAALLLSLQQYDQAMVTLENALCLRMDPASNSLPETDDLLVLLADVKTYCLMSSVASASHQLQVALQRLEIAYSLQQQALQRTRADQLEGKKQQREAAAAICFRLAELYQQQRQTERALLFYQEALKQNEQHQQARLALARYHLMNNDLDACQQQCLTLSRIDPSNKEAAIMLADLMFRKNDHDAATFHFQTLVEKNPTNFEALAKLIELLRRAGRLSDAPRFIKLSERACATTASSMSAGLNYCKGLLHWYSNEPREALLQFNQARKDAMFSRRALSSMIEIYLFGDHAEFFTDGSDSKTSERTINQEHINAAEKLLSELKQLEQSARVTVLEAYVLMAAKQKARNEQALELLMKIATEDRDFVPALLASAHAFILLGDPAKARNQLKRISKIRVDPEYASDFERAWLLLADVYIETGKNDLAQELCKKSLQYNKSSAKAWELLGTISEKEQAYRDASEQYEHAWMLLNESSPSIGFKLAFNYLKAKRWVEAIDVCHKVLAKFPDYPKIRKEILDKARQSLRP